MSKKRLVILRSGNNSLHRNWTTKNKSWKLAISSFSTQSAESHPEADYFRFYRGGKWDGIVDFFDNNPSVIEEYDYFWLPDDDIDATPEDIEKLFEVVEANCLEVAQPSLTNNSFFWHPITLQYSRSSIRLTNFVEIMVPVLDRNMMRQVLLLMRGSGSKSGFGLDSLLAKLTSAPATQCAIIDAVAVHHTRPVGSVLAKAIEKNGTSGPEELHTLSGIVGIDLNKIRPATLAIMMRNGKYTKGRILCAVVEFIRQFPWLTGRRHNRNGLRVFGGAFYSQLFYKSDFARVSLDWRRPATPTEIEARRLAAARLDDMRRDNPHYPDDPLL